MPDVHARFSPSSSERLIRCPPSMLLSEEYGVPDQGSIYAEEGTEAHSLCEYLLRQAIGEEATDPRPEMKYYNPEMQECAEGYRDAVLEIYNGLEDAALFIEQRIDFSDYVQEGFGTSDCVIIGDGKLFVIDFKYGKGIPVSSEENSQLKCYALGAYKIFEPLYPIDEVFLVIYQPRISNYSQWSLSPEALITWAKDTLAPAADLAFRGGGDFNCGSWCRFCRAKSICRKRAEENLALARYDFARPEVLEDDEINVILGKLDQLTSWAEDVKSYALGRALSGYAWDDWKAVEGRSNRIFTDEDSVAKAVKDAGFNPYEQKLLGITAMERLLGKSQFRELLGSYVTRPQGKPTLVSRSDKRPELIQAM